MLKNNSNVKTIIISLAAISLAACSAGNQVNTTQEPVNSSPSPSTEVQSPTSTASIELGEVNFKEADQAKVIGNFEAVNNSVELNQTISTNAPIEMAGWAVSSDLSKPADMVIVTTGEENVIVATTSVSTDRPDVAKALNNSSLTKSGWTAQVDPSKLSGEQIMLRAWTYNSTTKEAHPLTNTFEITLK